LSSDREAYHVGQVARVVAGGNWMETERAKTGVKATY
jgi:hypothetical protein